MRLFKSVKSKFIVFTILFVLISVGIPTFFLIYQFRLNFKQRSEAMLESTLDVVRGGIDHIMQLGQNKNIPHILEKIALNPSIHHIRLVDEKGIIHYSSDTTELGQSIRQLSERHDIDLSAITARQITLLQKNGFYFAVEPIFNERECQSCHAPDKKVLAYLDVDTQYTPAERNFYTGSIHIGFLAIVIIIVLAVGFYLLFNRFINKPLQRQIEAMDDIEQGNLDRRLTENKSDEFGVLARHFNQMVERLQNSQGEIEDYHLEQLQRADKLVTLGELAAEMAHEINNPTAVIMSRADYMQLELDDHPDFQRYQDDLNVIMNQVTKISRITGSILKYSKKLPKNFSPIDLNKVIDESITILEPRFHKKKIHFNRHIQCQGCHIIGDSMQCEQVITNLLNNAIDALEPEGRLDIYMHCPDQQHVVLKISDNGCGMDESTRKQIFTPFFTTKAQGLGTGLGLYIVKNICHNHGAEISFESEEGKGTSFTVTFNKITTS